MLGLNKCVLLDVFPHILVTCLLGGMICNITVVVSLGTRPSACEGLVPRLVGILRINYS